MAKGQNFFQNIISSFLNGGSAEAIKKRALKNVAKNLSKSRYRFYKYSSNMAEPALAKYFYDIYKVISPAQLIFLNAAPNMLKKVVLSTAFTEEMYEEMQTFSEEAIIANAREMDIKEVHKKITKALTNFCSKFDSNKIRQVDSLYTKLVLFSNFCKYDFYYILKRFDPRLKERSFSEQPKFQAISAANISEELKNYVSLAWVLPFEESWDDLFALLKRMKGVEPIAPATWKKMVPYIAGPRNQRTFEMMIQLITGDLMYRETPKPEEFHIMDEYLQEIRKQAEDTLNRIQEEQTAGKIDGLVSQIFGSASIDSLKNYNSENSEIYIKKKFQGFLYCDPLKYLRSFLLDYAKKDLRELSDIILVRGDWATQSMATPMSEAYHQLIDISAGITKLDEKLLENGEYGMKLKTLLPRCERDKEARNIMNIVLNDANDEAGTLILKASKNLIIFDKNLKMALEDFLKLPHSELIINWKELDHFAEGNLKQMCVTAYKKIYLFVTLLQNYSVSVRNQEDI